jgi:tetratricopeptide (TPR) repeat protein
MTVFLLTAIVSVLVADHEERLDAAYALMLDGHRRAALEIYEAILDEDPDQLKALEMAGYILYKGFYFSEAEALFSRALKIQDNYPSLLMLGNIALNRFQPALALQFYARARRIKPDDEVLADNIALARERIARAGKLITHYRRATWIYWCGVAVGMVAVLGFVFLEIRSALDKRRSRHPV